MVKFDFEEGLVKETSSRERLKKAIPSHGCFVIPSIGKFYLRIYNIDYKWIVINEGAGLYTSLCGNIEDLLDDLEQEELEVDDIIFLKEGMINLNIEVKKQER